MSRSILDDVRWLLKDSPAPQGDKEGQDPWFGPVRHASDYFPTICEAAIYLIKNGLAYVDDLTPGWTSCLVYCNLSDTTTYVTEMFNIFYQKNQFVSKMIKAFTF